MTRICLPTLAIALSCISAASADDWRCWSRPVYYVPYPVEPCPATPQAARPVTAAKKELAPAPRSTPRGTPAAVSAPAAPATLSPAPSSRVPSNFSRDYGPEQPAAPGVEPSSAPRRPEVSESTERKQYYDAYFVAEGDGPALRQARDGGRSVCFWNLSANRVTFRVEGKPYTLERGKQVTLDLPSQFKWQLDGRAAEHTLFEEERTALEIVIRR